jgi:hypothetical protein
VSRPSTTVAVAPQGDTHIGQDVATLLARSADMAPPTALGSTPPQ